MPARYTRRTAAQRPRQTWRGQIERLGWNGVGVGRLDDGRVVLLNAPLALFPGEEVTAQIEVHARHAEGVVTGWIQRDAGRVEAGCDYAESCGGCRLWGAGKLAGELKWLMVQDLLARQLKSAPVCRWLPAPAKALRSRIQLHWDGAALGYHRPHSNELVAVSSCPMAVGPVSAAIPALERALAAGALPQAADRWELATGTPPGAVLATAGPEPGNAWQLTDGEWRETSEPLLHELGGLRLRQSAGTFFQVSPEWAWQAFSDVFSGWELGGDALFDLYAGNGFFTLLLGPRFRTSTLVESSAASCADAQWNLEVNPGRVPQAIAIVNADVSEWLVTATGSGDDTILLDPPRAGLPPAILAKLVTARAGTLVLVGCDGMAFCRDVKRLEPAWQLSGLAAIDLFPNTPQCEFVGLLRRSPTG